MSQALLPGGCLSSLLTSLMARFLVHVAAPLPEEAPRNGAGLALWPTSAAQALY